MSPGDGAPSDLVASPVMVGRDDLLAHAGRRLQMAAAGHGQLMFVAGEAGIGKTRLLTYLARRAVRDDFTVARGAAFPGDAETSGGVLLDLAADLVRSVDPTAQAVGRALSSRLHAPSPEGDRHRQRRLLVQDLADAITDLGADRPTLVVLEDLHWADQLSLEVIAHAAARMTMRATLFVAALRSDELYPGTAVRDWRARLLSQRLAEEIRLPRLSLANTATVTSTVLGHPAPAQLVAAIHDRSDGIPLHIEELLAAAQRRPSGVSDDGVAGRAGDAVVRQVDVPDTLADAVLGRATTLDGESRDIASAAAVIGRSFDFDLLTAVTGQDPEMVDRCLRQLRSLQLVSAGSEPDRFDFRHALIRDTLYADITQPRRRELHREVATAGVHRGYPEAFVSLHFEQGRQPEAYPHAVAAARLAADVSAHREALELYRRAQRNLPPELPAQDLAVLLTALGTEAAAVDDNAAAATAFEQARELFVGLGQPVAAAGVTTKSVAVAHLLGEGLQGRVERLQSALGALDAFAERLDPADSGQRATADVRAEVLSALAAAYMLDRRLDEAMRYGEQSRLAVAGRPGEELDDSELNTAATLGAVFLFAGRMDEGWSLLRDAVARSVDGHREAEAGRSYRMIGTSASVLVEYDQAEHWLTQGIDYSLRAELWNHRSYMAAHLAHVQWACGAWDQAEATAEQALADGRGGVTTQITALYVMGYLAMGRGDLDRADQLDRQALGLGVGMGELQRISPPLWGLAETALLRGDLAGAVTLTERGFAESQEVVDAAYLFPFLVTGTRARLRRGDVAAAREWVERLTAALEHRQVPGTLPAVDHARGLVELATGDLGAAAATLRSAQSAWSGRRRFWEGTWALVDQARCAFRLRRSAEAERLAATAREQAISAGAAVLVDAVDALLAEQVRAAGRPRPLWHPLTAREYDVATLVAEGMTNREIAARLVLAPKTVSSHVEHILTKLDVSRRAEIAAWAARIES